MGKLLKSKNGTLLSEFIDLLNGAKQVDISVGYANIGGFNLIMQSLEKVDKIRVLVGMEDNTELKDVVHRVKNDILANNTRLSRFIQLIKSNKLEIRFDAEGTYHAKGYIFTKYDGKHSTILGSNNMTYTGIKLNKELASTDPELYQDMLSDFEEEWSKAKSEFSFVKELESEIKERPQSIILSQYEMFIRVLHDLYGDNLDIDLSKSTPKNFKLLKYQEDAVIQLENILQVHNGCFLSDVVGLGKTFVSALSLLRLPQGSKPLVVVPAGVVNTWRQVLDDFKLHGVEVLSHHQLHKYTTPNGKHYTSTEFFTHIYVDEAHKFRNSETSSYKKLKALCTHEKGTKVVLITATPLNNNPKELRNMLALFQNLHGVNTLIEGKSINRYLAPFIRNINKARNSNQKVKVNEAVESTGRVLRESIINKITVRRTRKDITKFYEEDMIQNGWVFPTVNKPNRIEYDISRRQNKILDITYDAFKTMTFARYRLQNYLGDNVFEHSHNFLANIVKTNLMKRLDSSIPAFVISLQNMLERYEKTVEDFNKGFIRKIIQDSDSNNDLVDGEFIPVTDLVNPEKFISDVKEDLSALEDLITYWGIKDPKVDKLEETLSSLDVSNGKVLIFSQYKDTVNYLTAELRSRGFRVLGYHSDLSNTREIVDRNFDANSDIQDDDFDILVTTDSLSEGVNLHRSNKVINYDIPWNPTLVIQRVGRANRIGTKFDQIDIYNFFPIDGTDKVIKSERNIISKLKTAFHLFGDDTNVLTDDDELDSIETIEEQIHSDIDRTNNMETEEENIDAYYQKLLREFKSSNPKRYHWLTQLQGDLLATKNEDLQTIEAFFYVGKQAETPFYTIKDGKVQSLTKHEGLSLLTCVDLPILNTFLSLEKVDQFKHLLHSHLSSKSREEFISENNSIYSGGAVLNYLKLLFRSEKDTQVKSEIKGIINHMRQQDYILDSTTEQEIKQIVQNKGSFKELQELFESCDLKSNFNNQFDFCIKASIF